MQGVKSQGGEPGATGRGEAARRGEIWGLHQPHTPCSIPLLPIPTALPLKRSGGQVGAFPAWLENKKKVGWILTDLGTARIASSHPSTGSRRCQMGVISACREGFLHARAGLAANSPGVEGEGGSELKPALVWGVHRPLAAGLISDPELSRAVNITSAPTRLPPSLPLQIPLANVTCAGAEWKKELLPPQITGARSLAKLVALGVGGR